MITMHHAKSLPIRIWRISLRGSVSLVRGVCRKSKYSKCRQKPYDTICDGHSMQEAMDAMPIADVYRCQPHDAMTSYIYPILPSTFFAQRTTIPHYRVSRELD